jgi:molybdopterin-containing oxidoreductase family membrane subunit
VFFINCGMWFEKIIIIITSFHRDYLPSSWVMYSPTFFEMSIWACVVLVVVLLLIERNKKNS